jgi:hypothetical protein
MTQEETHGWVTSLLHSIAVFTVFIVICMAAGYFVTKMEKSGMKKTVPDCGSCRIYKGEKK